ncbi:complement factor H-like isoform X2 [Hypomesus transpacificus]|uniref:complement factor H-like isoform X2 n=1 Tax=Hypomesus transpacificus TaxID=137520 RepID=UPI001F07D700|nr:complement factor H-like isoform X2 [Hypomesus transpacificus]
MHVLIRSFILVSWMYTVSVEAQGCKIDDFDPINKEGFTTHNLQKEYPVGAAVRVLCQTGYEGFYKMKCAEDGTWSSQNEECKRKQCGHPGESPNADFELTESSSDFSFGSEVLYKCKPGYVMISRSPIRTCMSQGWSNMVPVCEALKCPPLHIDDNMYAYGEYTEATSGTVVTFKCKSSNMIVDGHGNIDCNNQGEWSGKVPTCKILKCVAPTLENGLIRNRKDVYDMNDFLDFDCQDKYIKFDTQMNPRCVKMGNSAQWNPQPRCEEIKCELTPSDKGLYTPSGKTFFSIGDRLRVECYRGNWIQQSQQPSETAICEKNGSWKPGPYAPVCEEIRCRKPGVPHLKIRPWRQDYKFQESVIFSCDDGYELKGNAEARCTPTGWSSIPTCKDITCDRNDIKHAHFPQSKTVYKLGEKLTCSCLENLSKEYDVECTRNGWYNKPQCSGTDKCKSIKNGFVVKGESNVIFYYACNDGYMLPHGGWWDEAECTEGIWKQLKPCIEKSRCHTLPEIPHAKTKVLLEDGVTGIVYIQCKEGYTPEEISIECKNGRWETPPKCLRKETTCTSPPKVENAVVLTAFQSGYADKSTVDYECRKSYKLTGNKTIECTRGTWSKSPTCKRKSEDTGTEISKTPTPNPASTLTNTANPQSQIQPIDPSQA